MSFRLLPCLIALLAGGAPALSQDAPAPMLSVELNTAADTAEGACRMTFVANNSLAVPLEATSFQFGVFDADGAVSRLIVLDFGALPVGKTKIVQFDIPGQTCAQISRIVVNDVAQCTTTGGAAVDGCLTSLATASRGTIQFGL
jgi:hypothetical protein